MAKLLATASITAVVGNRIYWQTRPQGQATYPTIVLQKVSGIPTVTNDGPAGQVETRVQIDCWALTFASVLSASRPVNALLSGGLFTQDGVDFQGCFLESERQTFEEPSSTSPERLHRVSLDYDIWHTE